MALHTSVLAEAGLRATAPYLADLLVEDLADDGARLRKRVPEMLDLLVIDGRLMRIDEDWYHPRHGRSDVRDSHLRW